MQFNGYFMQSLRAAIVCHQCTTFRSEKAAFLTETWCIGVHRTHRRVPGISTRIGRVGDCRVPFHQRGATSGASKVSLLSGPAQRAVDELEVPLRGANKLAGIERLGGNERIYHGRSIGALQRI